MKIDTIVAEINKMVVPNLKRWLVLILLSSHDGIDIFG